MRLAATMTNVLLVHHTEKLYTALYVKNFQEKKKRTVSIKLFVHSLLVSKRLE